MQLKKKNNFYLLYFRLKKLLIYSKASIFSTSFLVFIKTGLNSSELNDRKNILVVQTDKLGDIVLSLTFLFNLSESEKDCEKFLLIDEKYSKGLFSAEFPFKLIPINKSKYKFNLFYRVKLLNEIRHLNLKLSINISPGRGVINDEVTLKSGAEVLMCVSQSTDFLPDRLLWKNNSGYNSILVSNSKNEFIRLQELFSNIYQQDYGKDPGSQSLLQSHKPLIHLDNSYIVIAPSSSEQNRNWSKENFRSLCEKLSNKLPVYLVGTFSQSDYLRFISEGTQNVKNLAGCISLGESIYLIEHCSIFIGLDSGFTHLAEIFNKPYVAIIGGGKYGRFFPYPLTSIYKYKFYELSCFNCNWNCIYKEAYCISLVSVEEVYKSCISMIEPV